MAIKSIILSVTTLPHSLTQFLREKLNQTTFFERDLSSNSEGDIILSSNRCVLFFTLAQITQSLPSLATSRILDVAELYRSTELIIQCHSMPRGKDLAPFQGWITSLQKQVYVRTFYAVGDQELLQWTAWLCVQTDMDDAMALLKDEETEVNGTFLQDNLLGGVVSERDL
jgi:hypothetical protein